MSVHEAGAHEGSAVRAKSLSVGFKERVTPVIDSLDLTIGRGETFGITGPSGCGKSTLLRVLAGINLVWRGTVELFDRALKPGQRFEAGLRRDVQMVFQDPYASLHPRHTIARVLLEPLKLLGAVDPTASMIRALEDVGLEPALAARYPHQLSGGQRQRVAIARACLSAPRLLLLDEPTSALDLSVQAEILNLLSELKAARDITLVLVSHDMCVLAHLCDRAALMREGRIERIRGRSDLDHIDS